MIDSAQLPLPVYLRDDATLENYFFGAELMPLRRALEQQAGPGGDPMLFLHGVSQSGRSHLLQAACHRCEPGSALYLPLRELAAYPASEITEGVEHLTLVALDDLEAVLGDPAWEEALFHLVNRSRANECRLLLSANNAPRYLPVGLADLASRLSWSTVFRLPEVSDEQRLAVLKFRAARRGMNLSPEAASYVLSRSGRSMGDLVAVLDTLDKTSMAQQRALSVPFIKKALGW